MTLTRLPMLIAIAWLLPCAYADEPSSKAKPLFQEFMGINGHTIKFKADVYAPACRAVRDYHPIDWDFGDDTSFAPPFPFARNRVDWSQVYGGWKRAGFETDVCLMFDNLPAKDWKNPASDARNYGKSFASAFGPSSADPLVSAAEIGNEPGLYDDASYRTIFENMARGLREGDPKLKVGTCAITTGKGDRYSKSVSCVEGLNDLYDFLNIHSYAEVEGWPTWKRTFPEDPKNDYLKRIDDLIAWRDGHAPGKAIRVTEFGWDASSKTAPASGDFAKWIGSTETEQARYLVRSFLLFSKKDVSLAYIYFFDDQDEPQLHGSSGLTRKGQPKPAFHAVAHLQTTLGDYRFAKVIRENPGELMIYEYVHGEDSSQRIWAAWSPTGSGRSESVSIDLGKLRLASASRMPLAKDGVKEETLDVRDGKLRFIVDESTIYLRLEGK